MLTQQQILTASLNDIVFQNRNQTYGAYELRNAYNHHLKIAIGVMLGLCLGAFVFYFNSSSSDNIKDLNGFKPDPGLVLVKPPVSEIQLPPPPQPPPAVKQVLRSEIFTQPIIVIDNDVSDEDLPPEQDALVGAIIGLEKSAGAEIGTIVAPPVEKSMAEVIVPVDKENINTKIWTKVEIPAEFPGGASEWTRYLQKNLRYPDQAIDNGTQAVIRVQFIVDREGNISDVEALNDPGDGLAEEAVRIIKKGPKWKPAEQNGQKVIFRNIQAVTFRLN